MYCDKFPAFFGKEINHCISKATRSIRVACDFFTYGAFSDYRSWQSYVKTLIDKKGDANLKVDVQMILLSRNQRQTLLEEQFAKDDDSWKNLASTSAFNELLVAFATRELIPIVNRAPHSPPPVNSTTATC